MLNEKFNNGLNNMFNENTENSNINIDREILKNFIVIEGLDGAGTTTQLKLLDRELSLRNIPHHCTFEPTDFEIGRLIRDILHKKTKSNRDTIALLFAADRNEHIYRKDGGIIAHLTKKELVICDRYLFSSLAYQSVDCGFNFVFSLNSRFPLPEYLIYIDTPVMISQERINKRPGNELFDIKVFQEKVRKNYTDIFKLFSRSRMKIATVKGDMPIEAIHSSIMDILLEDRLKGLSFN
ncbi:MAG: dTMP kinase [Spirochaetales bacterium]|nr:dTMP kinase [Spirochaetales bacterium]